MQDQRRPSRVNKPVVGTAVAAAVLFVRVYWLVFRTRAAIVANVFRDRPGFCLAVGLLLVIGYVAACWRVLFPVGEQLSEFFTQMESELTHRHAVRVVCVMDLFVLALLAPGFVSSIRNSCTRDSIVRLVYLDLRQEWIVVGLAFVDVLASCLLLHLVLSPVFWAPFVAQLTVWEICRRVIVCLVLALVGIVIAAAWLALSFFLEGSRRPLTWMWLAAISGYLSLIFVAREIRASFSEQGSGSFAQSTILYAMDMMQTESIALLLAGLVTALLLTAWAGLWVCDGMRRGGSLE